MIDLPGEGTADGFFRIPLPGGVRLVGQHVSGRRSVALGVWVAAGSRDETAGREGLAHFIEHMVFKGTRRRSAAEIAYSLERVGGSLDAFTGKETTCFYARVLSEHVEPALDVLADLVSRPRFAVSDVALERGVVEEELQSAEDVPEDLIGELAHQHLWPDHILGSPILGSRESLAGIDAEAVTGFHARHYRLPRIVVSATGAVDPELLAPLIPQYLECPAEDPGPERNPPSPHVPTLAVHERDLAQLHLALVTPAPTARDPRRRAAQLLSDMLGGGMSSRLFQKIREEAGLAYSVFSTTEHYDDAGLLEVSLTVSPHRGEEALSRTLEVTREMRDQGLVAGELDAAKAQACASLVMGLESLSNLMFHLARTEYARGEYESLEETIASFERVSEDDVRAAADELLDPDRWTLVALGAASRAALAWRDFPRVVEATTP